MAKAQKVNGCVPIDFVAGTHGHFLEFVLNKFFGITPFEAAPFTSLGTSHSVSKEYQQTRLFRAEHWFEYYKQELSSHNKIISIRFDQDDLLLVSSLSLLRAADLNLHNDELEINTVSKLDNQYYRGILEQIYQAYPFLDRSAPGIPRNILREYYKFGFSCPDINGYWLKLQQMDYHNDADVYNIKLKDFYDIAKFESSLKNIEKWLDMKFDFNDEFYSLHQNFLTKIQFLDHKKVCDEIIKSVINRVSQPIPKLTLFQESYINGKLENYFKKEMPFHDLKYFNSTQDIVYYIDNHAINL